MNKSPNIRHVVKAVKSILDAHKADMDRALQSVVPNQSVQMVLPFFSKNPDAKMIPFLMIAQNDEDRRWIGMPSIAEDTFRLSIFGIVQYDREEFIDDLVGYLAGSVKDILNQRHLPITVEDNYQIYFNDTCPVSSIRYGIPSWIGTGTAVRGFEAAFSSNCDIVVKDETT